jgi:glutathione reductase (NADPH)
MPDKSPETDFDLIVIGAGTGGNGVARSAAAAGWKVASVDILPYGGTCALRGCDPKKMMVAVSEGVDWADNMAGKGLEADNVTVNWPDMLAFKRTFTDKMPPMIEGGMAKAGIATLHGQARFTSKTTLEIDGKPITARHFHIATGARPVTLGIKGEDHLITSTDFLDLTQKPARIVFVGGGFIAMEFAHISQRSGATAVTVLQQGKRPLMPFDPDMVELLSHSSRELGIDLHCEARVERVTKSGEDLTVEFSTPDGTDRITCDLVVHAAGRVPNIDDLNLEAAGVAYSARGVTVSEYMRSTSNPNVFAAGDCADSGPNLTPVSANEGRIVGKNLLAGKDVRAIKYPPIPSVVFTLPPVASVGLSEVAATEMGLDFDVNTGATAGWYSSMRVGAKRSGFKVLVEKGTGLILGAHLIGPGAEEQINLFAMAMGAGLSANQIKAMIFAYPSYASDLSSMV